MATTSNVPPPPKAPPPLQNTKVSPTPAAKPAALLSPARLAPKQDPSSVPLSKNPPSSKSSPVGHLSSRNVPPSSHPPNHSSLPGLSPSITLPGQPSAPRGAPPGPPKEPPPQPPKSPPPLLPAKKGPDIEVENETTASHAALQGLLHRGRLSFTLVEARELRHTEKSGKFGRFSANTFVKIAIGKNPSSSLIKRSKTLKKSGSLINLHEEVISFDITDPIQLLTDGDLPIKMELLNESLLSDELLGEANFSALRFFDGKPHQEVKSIYLLKAFSGVIEIKVMLEKALVGMLSIVLVEGRNLKSMELIGKQDPYCQLSIGKFAKRSKTIERGGCNPYFGKEELLFWFGDDLWTQRMKFRVFDHDIGSDDLIGETTFSVLHFMAQRGEQDHTIPLQYKGILTGEVLIQTEFFPAGELTVTCHAAKQLRSVDVVGRQDPYVKFTLEGRVTQVVKKTKTDLDGGSEPEWDNETFYFDIVDQYNLQVEVWDEDIVGADELIGSASLSLLPIFRYGYVDDWLKLWVKGRFGDRDFAGHLRLEMRFKGPAGVAFPQHQANMDSFTEKERLTKNAAKNISKMSDERENTSTSATALTHYQSREPVGDNVNEFSEEELISAFQFLDIDKNAYIGAAELRHLLICMGEIITDAEVDEMMRLCDKDGDGQVSFDEFRRMALHPDPGGSEFGTATAEPESQEPLDILAITSKNNEGQQELKREKTKLLRHFVENTNPSLGTLEHVAKTFRHMQHHALNFDDFCSLFNLEPTGENRRLFALFTPDYQSDIGADLSEILLAAVNFIGGVDRTQHVRFCFEISDKDRNGFITEEELVNILRANYLVSTDDQVRRKAQTILRQADSDGDGRVSLDEFHVISRMFPKLLFPPHDADTA
ncbi:putative EF-hand domain, phosphatidylinositol-4, 5-bisphosphate phosphodiesterase gamma [Plasmopara halstedii]